MGLGGRLWSDEYVLYLDWGSGYMSVYICQNSSNHTLKMGTFYCTQWKLYVNRVDKKWEGNDKYKTQDNGYCMVE